MKLGSYTLTLLEAGCSCRNALIVVLILPQVAIPAQSVAIDFHLPLARLVAACAIGFASTFIRDLPDLGLQFNLRYRPSDSAGCEGETEQETESQGGCYEFHYQFL
jgi:hypothetical protein